MNTNLKRHLSKRTTHYQDIDQTAHLVPVVTQVQSCSAQLLQVSTVPPISWACVVRFLSGLLYLALFLNLDFMCIVVCLPTVSIILNAHAYSCGCVFLVLLA